MKLKIISFKKYKGNFFFMHFLNGARVSKNAFLLMRVPFKKQVKKVVLFFGR